MISEYIQAPSNQDLAEHNSNTAQALTPEQQTIQELQARINQLELEKKILKEATALLMAKEHGRRR